MNRQYGIDFARFVAACLVASGHLVFGGALATDDTYRKWALSGEQLPLLDKAKFDLWRVNDWLLTEFSTATAIIGVALFFMISGWVVPPMLHRYSTSQFLINRVFRIYPMLIASVAIAAAIQFTFGNRSALNFPAAVSTAFLVNEITNFPRTLGLVWTLVIEVKFVLILAIIGKLSRNKIYSLSALICLAGVVQYVLIYSGAYDARSYTLQLINANLLDFHYAVFMLIGASLWIELQNKEALGVSSLLGPILLVGAFNLARYVVTVPLGIIPTQDINLVTQAVVYFAFGAILWLQMRFYHKKTANVIRWFSNMTYSLYLLHVSIGVFLMSWLRHYIDNPYLLLSSVAVILLLTSTATYKLVETPMNQWAKKGLRGIVIP